MRSPKGRNGRKEANGSSHREKSTKASARGKRVKFPATSKQQKSQPEPEIFPDHRSLCRQKCLLDLTASFMINDIIKAICQDVLSDGKLEDLWQAAFPVGTEWDNLDSVYKINWDFSNLEEIISESYFAYISAYRAFEENGVLYGKRVYLFGCTEPQLVFFDGRSKIVCIPVVVAVTSPFPPSDKIGIKSVQMEGETVVPMKQMKMDWVPYIPLENRLSRVESLKSQIFTMQCTQRRAALKQLKQEQIKKYEYCLPYFYQPLKEDEIEQDTVVQIMYPMEPPIVCEFDWEFDEIQEFTDNLVKEEALQPEQKEEFMKFVRERVTESKKKQRQAREARKKAIEEMSPESKAAFQSMRFYKFYPVQTPGTPDISNVKVPFINRYYGKAHAVL